MIAALLLATVLQPSPPRFGVEVERVSVDVFVRRGGAAVPGLTAADFTVEDDGVAQEVEVIDLSQAPLGAVLALDASGSVTGEKLRALQEAASAFGEGLGEGDEAAVLTFSHVIALLAGPSRDRAMVASAVRGVRPEGSTALFDGLFAALTLPLTAPRRLVVLFTDGADNSSVLGAPDLADDAASSDVLLYVVAAGDEERRTAIAGEDTGPQREPATRRELRLLAEATGGQLYEAGKPEELRGEFLRILEEMRMRYVLSFSPACNRKSGAHRLEVRVKAPGVHVRARKSYRSAPRR